MPDYEYLSPDDDFDLHELFGADREIIRMFLRHGYRPDRMPPLVMASNPDDGKLTLLGWDKGSGQTIIQAARQWWDRQPDPARVPRNAPCPCGSGKKAKKCHIEYTLPPVPGLDDTFTGSCLMCLRGTEERLAIVGEPEFIMSLLMMGGLSYEEALGIIVSILEESPVLQEQPVGHFLLQLCAICQRRTFDLDKLPSTPPGAIRVIQQPEEIMKLETQMALTEARIVAEREAELIERETGYCSACKKVSFPSEKSAVKRIQQLWLTLKEEDPNPPHRAYECPTGNGWHLTRRNLG